MTPLDQEHKVTQPLKQPQKHFKTIDTFYNIIMSPNAHLNLNFSLTQIHHYPRISIQEEHLTIFNLSFSYSLVL